MKNINMLQNPKDQRYYQVIALLMGCLALNTQYWSWFDMPKLFLYRLQRILVIIALPLAVMSQTFYLVVNHNKHEFQALSMMYAILPVTIIVCLKVLVAQTKAYKAVMEDLMPKIHLYNYLNTSKDESIQVKEIVIKAEKLIRWSNYYLLFFTYSAAAGFEIVPIVHNVRKFESLKNITSRLEIVVHFWLPFDYEYNFTNWVIVQTTCFYCGIVCMAIIALFDTMNLTFLYHIIGHIEICKHRIRNSFKDDMAQEDVTKNIIKISRYYGFITQTLKEVEKAFGLNVASIYIHNLFGGGLFIYQLSVSGSETGTILTYGLMIPLYMGILIIVSFALEYIRIAADDIPDLIYGLKWETMSMANRKLLLMVLCQVQPVLEFKAAFNIKTGVQPAVNIIKTTFSFYVMIKSSV